eukprot:TRINITY_DN3143_c4_g2_i2.p1 TRINITY_DN3143_c4_g2~~TRINITY_DN3143_c4_g2_i2.p1  ORF type:complete len:426 (+),score=93.56 TRINITY_DN3143_c4_g2_i2:56-1333(+)
MITPYFIVNQTDGFIQIDIRAPHIKTESIEYSIVRNVFRFYCDPFFLRLTFEKEFNPKIPETVSYEWKTGFVHFEFAKGNSGVTWNDLQLVSKLLKSQTNSESSTNIEIIDDEPIEMSWELDQEEVCIKEFNKFKYGFDNRHQNFFANFFDDPLRVVDLVDPDNTEPKERTRLRLDHEANFFDAEWLFNDVIEFDTLNTALNVVMPWDVGFEWSEDEEEDNYDLRLLGVEHFSQDEQQILKLIPKTFGAVEKPKMCSFMLIDICFSTIFNLRMSFCLENPESPWNITKISPTFSFFETFKTLKSLLQALARRTLTYPLLRSWEFFVKCLKDLVTLFKKGQSFVVKVLLLTKYTLEKDSGKHVLNKLYVDELIIFCQFLPPSLFKDLTEELADQTLHISPSILGPVEEVVKACTNIFNQQMNSHQQ